VAAFGAALLLMILYCRMASPLMSFLAIMCTWESRASWRRSRRLLGPAGHGADHAVTDPGTSSPSGQTWTGQRVPGRSAGVRTVSADTRANRKVVVQPCSVRSRRTRRSYRHRAFF
jgi:hypothetical protein